MRNRPVKLEVSAKFEERSMLTRKVKVRAKHKIGIPSVFADTLDVNEGDFLFLQFRRGSDGQYYLVCRKLTEEELEEEEKW